MTQTDLGDAGGAYENVFAYYETEGVQLPDALLVDFAPSRPHRRDT